ncbi:MCE family protein [candidate division KSB1 bacterium]|nr:MCE family protein [candidate division KSB1 bacterium]
MEYRSSEIKAGIFIMVSLLLFLVFVLVISGVGSWGGKELYRARFEYVGGVEKGSLVRFAGLEVGRVKELRIPQEGDSRIELVLEVQENTPIRTNSLAKLSTIGIMGAYYVEISPGTPEEELLPPGSLIQTKWVSGIAQLAEPSGEALSEIKELLSRLNQLLDQENRENLASLLRALNDIAEGNANQSKVLMQNLGRATAQLEETLSLTNRILAQNDSTLHNGLTHMDQMLAESVQAVERINLLTQTLHHTVEQNQGDLRRMSENMRRMSENLNDFSLRLKEEPWSLVRKNYPPKRQLPD